MSFRDLAIDITSDIIDALGESDCVYIPQYGDRKTITAIVEQGTFEIEAEGSYRVYNARLDAKSVDVPVAREGDVLSVNFGTTASPSWHDFCLIDPHVDKLGITTAWLEST